MRYAVSVLTLLVVVASAYFFVLDARSKHIVDQYRPPAPKKTKKAAHATLVPIPEQKSTYKIALTSKAAERVGLKTAPIREATTQRKRVLTGVVETSAGGGIVIAVPLAGPTDEPTPQQSAPVRKVGAAAIVATARLEATAAQTGETPGRIARFRLDGAGAALANGERVQLEVALGSAGARKLIASSAIVYDPKGGAWVYVATEPLAFLRVPVKLDYIENGIAHLREGPRDGTAVAVGGVVEIAGTESRIGSVSISASF